MTPPDWLCPKTLRWVAEQMREAYRRDRETLTDSGREFFRGRHVANIMAARRLFNLAWRRGFDVAVKQRKWSERRGKA